MEKTDFIEVAPPLGPVIVLSGNFYLISPAFNEDGSLEEIDFYLHAIKKGTVTAGSVDSINYIPSNVYRFIGDDARRIAGALNARFGLHIGAKSAVELDKVREIKSSLGDAK